MNIIITGALIILFLTVIFLYLDCRKKENELFDMRQHIAHIDLELNRLTHYTICANGECKQGIDAFDYLFKLLTQGKQVEIQLKDAE